MEQITINSKNYNIPSSWGETSFAQFLKLNTYLNSVKELEEYPDDIFYANILAIFTNTDKGSYATLSLIDNIKFRKGIQFIATKFDNDIYSNTLEYNGLIFKVRNFEELKYGEYLDIQHLTSEIKDDSVIKALAFMCDIYEKKNILKLRFKDKKIEYKKEYKEKLIGSLPATKANAIVAFFLRGQKQSVNNIVSYLNKTARQLHTKVFFQAVGLIISGLWMRVKKILLSLMMLLTFRFDRSLHIWRTKLPRII
jgi:hypothetical protein